MSCPSLGEEKTRKKLWKKIYWRKVWGKKFLRGFITYNIVDNISRKHLWYYAISLNVFTVK